MSAESIVDALYSGVSTEPGERIDWTALRALFDESARFVLRTGAETTSTFDLDGWIDDFQRFVTKDDVERRGFFERIVRREATTFGDIAHVLVLYEAGFPGEERPPRPGVDSIQLVREDGHWRIVSILNELPRDGRPLPAVLTD